MWSTEPNDGDESKDKVDNLKGEFFDHHKKRRFALKTPDDHWKFTSETAIKAKSVTGYSICNTKVTQNKFLEGVPKPEVVDDWDQRLITTTFLLDRDTLSIILLQKAEKDQVTITSLDKHIMRYCRNSEMTVKYQLLLTKMIPIS